jgi:glycosyltransferase involved in cell wall biosynthesis
MKVSIVTAAYNSAATIADTLRSVNAQTHPDIEHVIIDGASRDATLSIVREIGQRVGHVSSERDKGIYDAMNKGLAAASGDVIGILNSDDLYAGPEVIAHVVRAFEEDPTLEAIYGDLCYVRQDDVSQTVRYWESSPYRAGLFQTGWVPPHPTFFVRRSTYQRLGGFDLAYRLAADWELLVRFIEVHCIRTRYLHETLVLMRMGGATNQSLRNVWRQNQEIWRAAQHHGLRPSIGRFVFGKILSRGQQYLSRATG